MVCPTLAPSNQMHLALFLGAQYNGLLLQVHLRDMVQFRLLRGPNGAGHS